MNCTICLVAWLSFVAFVCWLSGSAWPCLLVLAFNCNEKPNQSNDEKPK